MNHKYCHFVLLCRAVLGQGLNVFTFISCRDVQWYSLTESQVLSLCSAVPCSSWPGVQCFYIYKLCRSMNHKYCHFVLLCRAVLGQGLNVFTFISCRDVQWYSLTESQVLSLCSAVPCSSWPGAQCFYIYKLS